MAGVCPEMEQFLTEPKQDMEKKCLAIERWLDGKDERLILCHWVLLSGDSRRLFWDKGNIRKMNYMYIVECRDASLYTGWTNDLEKRVKTHNSGKGAKYTRSRRPVTLRYWECFDTKEEAMRREAEVKRLSREEKQELFQGKS